jgi:GT2 family glycosyltransferase
MPQAARLNRVARTASGDHLLVLDEHAGPFEPGWLDAMLEFSQLETVGAVGAVLLREDGTIEDAGLVLGAGGLAACAFQGEPGWTPGHRSNALDVRNCSAVTARCLLTRRAVFEGLHGFDEEWGSGHLEIDYGLRVQDAGLRVVVTPHARLGTGAPSAAFDTASPPAIARLRARWGARLDTDPYYNPNFDRRDATFRLPPAATNTQGYRPARITTDLSDKARDGWAPPRARIGGFGHSIN